MSPFSSIEVSTLIVWLPRTLIQMSPFFTNGNYSICSYNFNFVTPICHPSTQMATHSPLKLQLNFVTPTLMVTFNVSSWKGQKKQLIKTNFLEDSAWVVCIYDEHLESYWNISLVIYGLSRLYIWWTLGELF